MEPCIEQQIEQCQDMLRAVYGSDLLGLYLYGSVVTGGLQVFSDVDLLAVTNRRASVDEKTRIAHSLMAISGLYRKSKRRCIELTIVARPDVVPWRYPPRFDLQYGEWLRAGYEKGERELWSDKDQVDLAILLTQVLVASQTLDGPQPERLLERVPYCDFLTASTDEIDSLLADLESDTRNVLLTLARIWSTFATDAIRSKAAAAAWVAERLPETCRPVMERARAVYLGQAPDTGWDDLRDQVKFCAAFMVDQIKSLVVTLKADDQNERTIGVAN